ncbi:MAG: hypothetical protein WCH05_08935 [Chlorobiaceae bacterium]
MKPLFIFITSAILLGAMAVAFPEQLLSPGTLMSGHQKLERECLSCHKPFEGVKATVCASCHKPNDIGVRSVAGTPVEGNPGKALFHRGIDRASCLECHSDHKVVLSTKSYKPFVHEHISESLKNSCIICHKKQQPQNALHRSSRENCAACHTTRKWKPATFNHTSLTASAVTVCIECHKGDEPRDEMHRKSFASCGTCHATKKWKPSTLNHDKYFRLDEPHRTSCATCHTAPGNYKKYSCYGCHEHTPSNIAREHVKEGISNYQNCVKCHRSSSDRGDEHDDD